MAPSHARTVVLAVALAGCRAEPVAVEPPPFDLDATIAAAGRPLLVVVTNRPGDAATDPRAESVRLDLRDSARRAAAARYHATDADVPVLLGLTPAGLIVSRDGGPLTPDLARRRVDRALTDGPALDAQLAALRRSATDVPGRLRLAAFLHARGNDREAIAPLAAVAHDAAADVPTRVRAWVDLVRAHQWVGEPEKGRHEAQHLLATLGPLSPDAVAGGQLVLGLQDATAKRFDRARAEFAAAAAAAPASAYAAEARARLTAGGK